VLIERKSLEFRSSFLGRKRSAVTLVTGKDVSLRRATSGITDNFLPVEISGSIEPNRMLMVQVDGLTAHGLTGKRASRDAGVRTVKS
jgi:hypothetical protein